MQLNTWLWLIYDESSFWLKDTMQLLPYHGQPFWNRGWPPEIKMQIGDQDI